MTRLPDKAHSRRLCRHLSIEKTSVCLGIPAATVKTRFHRARNLMQQSLNAYLEAASLTIFDFAGARCDRMVAAVLDRLFETHASGKVQ